MPDVLMFPQVIFRITSVEGPQVGDLNIWSAR